MQSDPTNPLRYTLVADGTSGRVPLPILDWVIQQHLDENQAFESYFFDGGPRPSAGLAARIAQALALFPCDILFVRLDAENATYEKRVEEVRAAAARSGAERWIAVIPVRMTEAWLLSDAGAIRRAADNPRGKMALELPRKSWDRIADPKAELLAALERASGLPDRRRRRFAAHARYARVAQLTESFAPLRRLAAFQALERDVRAALGEPRLSRARGPV